MISLKFFISLCALFGLCASSNPFDAKQKSWDYTLISLGCNSSNEELLKWNLFVERISRSEYGLSGNITVNTDVNEDEYVNLAIYRSARGNKDYKPVPYKLDKQNGREFLNGAYKVLLMESLAECSNLPLAEGDEILLVEQKVYQLERCIISKDNFPSYVLPGFYKMQLILTGPIESIVEAIVLVETKD